MKIINPIYYLCNTNDEKILQFEMRFVYNDFFTIKTEVLDSELLPPFLQTCKNLDDSLYLYLHSLIPKYEQTFEFDTFVKNKLNLDEKILINGRLYGMEYLIELLEHHFYDEANKVYITPKEPVIISFVGKLYGWDRLFIDKPVSGGKLDVLNAQR